MTQVVGVPVSREGTRAVAERIARVMKDSPYEEVFSERGLQLTNAGKNRCGSLEAPDQQMRRAQTLHIQVRRYFLTLMAPI